MSQAIVAQASGVAQSEISRIERDQTMPSAARVERLVEAMGGQMSLRGPEPQTGPGHPSKRPVLPRARRAAERAVRAPDWEAVISAAVRLQSVLPGTTLVGGTAAGLHAHHRHSFDADHVLIDLRDRFDAVRAELESVVGWRTARVVRPVMLLGSLDGIETGVRQLRRTEPLETATIGTSEGSLRLPTRAEIIRIKAYLVLVRNATRDYLDVAALFAGMGRGEALDALASLDRLYPHDGDAGAVRQQLARQLSEPTPWDLDQVELAEYKGLVPPWTDWDAVVEACRGLSDAMVDAIAEARPGWHDVGGP